MAIPKSGHAGRQRANLGVFGFTLPEDEMDSLRELAAGEEEAADSGVHEEF